ncbi:hypothetical protein [Croceicoccus mobilis]|uniref:Uncharacterized protein n=1 Tax=Croceicoccus mobilis TaxID=1703339 RepID=A0A916YU38_9SPHN|nr:hypothetical protein [Croceicoccus mobilis]GGD60489.1 hypothetical protein GCM10010990_07430 [Croceicoccus mobilis]
MSINFQAITAQTAQGGAISDDEIMQLRREGWCDGQIGEAEAAAIFSINHALGTRSASWTDFFTEALSAYLLHQQQPAGYMSEEQADWLIAQVSIDGRVDSMAEIELLVRMIERAKNVPDSLKTFVLEQLEREVLSGTGPTRSGGELSDTHVTDAEVAIMRRVVFGQASDRPAAVSRREAELLFRIKDATLTAPNARGWKRLFVQGVGNYLQAYSGANAQISRDRAAELDNFMSDSASSVSRFLRRMAKAVPDGASLLNRKKDRPDISEMVANKAQVTASEKAWLDAQVEANGEIDEYDRALLHFLAGGDPPAA